MTIRDRGKRKWAPAFMMPEHGKFKRRLLREYYAQAKPLLDEYQIEEFENQIHLAMEGDSQVILTTWAEGYTYETKWPHPPLGPNRKRCTFKKHGELNSEN